MRLGSTGGFVRRLKNSNGQKRQVRSQCSAFERFDAGATTTTYDPTGSAVATELNRKSPALNSLLPLRLHLFLFSFSFLSPLLLIPFFCFSFAPPLLPLSLSFSFPLFRLSAPFASSPLYSSPLSVPFSFALFLHSHSIPGWFSFYVSHFL